MIQSLSILPIFVILCAQSISLSPELTFQYESDSEQYSTVNVPISDYELTIIGKYTLKKLNILTRMGYHLIDGMNAPPSDFTHDQGLHSYEHSPGLRNDQRNYYVGDMKFQYGDSANNIYFNKWSQHWGPGVNSLTISNKIPSFFHFGFNWELNDKIKFQYLHGKLKSNISDNTYVSYYSSGRVPDISRNIAAHRIEWRPFKQIIISGNDFVLYSNRLIEITYLIPFVPFFPMQTYIGEMDNALISGDIQYLPNDNLRLYGVILIDDWSPTYTFQAHNNNKFGWQTGLEWKNIFLFEDRFRIEFTWTDHRIYHHNYEVNDYYSWDYPIGFWAGPHSEEIYMDYLFALGDNQVQLLFSNTKRGEYTDSMRVYLYGRPPNTPMYERFGKNNYEICGDCVGAIESKNIFILLINRKIMKKMDVSFKYTYVDWENAGFNPSNPQIMEDITKHSMGIRFKFYY